MAITTIVQLPVTTILSDFTIAGEGSNPEMIDPARNGMELRAKAIRLGQKRSREASQQSTMVQYKLASEKNISRAAGAGTLSRFPDQNISTVAKIKKNMVQPRLEMSL